LCIGPQAFALEGGLQNNFSRCQGRFSANVRLASRFAVFLGLKCGESCLFWGAIGWFGANGG